MKDPLREDAEYIVRSAIASSMPDAAVKKALEKRTFPGRVFLVAAGKAAWNMARAAKETLGDRLSGGVAVTKYGHVSSPLPGIACHEGGHPVPDQRGVAGTEAALRLTENLGKDDTVLFLLSGGGSALFEKPLIPLEELADITAQLLASGCDITGINAVRKRLSAVKGGRFAARCAPAKVLTLAVSDVPAGRTDMIASGPTVPDTSTSAEAAEIVRRCGIRMSEKAMRLLCAETPRSLPGCEFEIIGSVKDLCAAAARAARERGYEPVPLTDCLSCEAKEAGAFLADILRSHAPDGKKTAWLAGGETVVHLSGRGLGGRNQEMALSAAAGIRGLKNAAVISVGSDGTDGPTDAAGGYADGNSYDALAEKGLSHERMMEDHDSYHALKEIGGLIITGPTGTNVNDISVGLLC